MLENRERPRGAWTARCECYAGHNSHSGRCNVRHVTDPTVTEAERRAPTYKAVRCDRCRKECEA